MLKPNQKVTDISYIHTSRCAYLRIEIIIDTVLFPIKRNEQMVRLNTETIMRAMIERLMWTKLIQSRLNTPIIFLKINKRIYGHSST